MYCIVVKVYLHIAFSLQPLQNNLHYYLQQDRKSESWTEINLKKSTNVTDMINLD